MLNEDDGTSGRTGDASRDPGADGVAEPIRIDGKIGTDPEELKRWADHVVSGKPIEHMEIADLRALIEAVQAHPEARLAPEPPDDGQRVADVVSANFTWLVVQRGLIVSARCESLCIRIQLAISADFAEWASFDHAAFAASTSFQGSRFSKGASLYGARFYGDTKFEHARFYGDASFNNTRFHRLASFSGSYFAERTSYDDSRFNGNTSFAGATFCGEWRALRAYFQHWLIISDVTTKFGVMFNSATFGGDVLCEGATFGGWVQFKHSTFSRETSFRATTFKRQASFQKAVFEDNVIFYKVAFTEIVRFDNTLFVSTCRCHDTYFASHVHGDLRAVDVSQAKAESLASRRRHTPSIMIEGWQARRDRLAALLADRRESPWEEHQEVSGLFHRVTDRIFSPIVIIWKLRSVHGKEGAYGRVLKEMVRAWLIHGWVGWGFVRNLGRLSILNRVSLFAIVAVPILAAVHISAQHIVAEAGGESTSIWLRWAAWAIGDRPHLSRTLAITFFASVCVTLGLLIYQTFAPETIKARDEDEHVRDLEARYSDENPALRGDGLRRSIERLEDQAKVRPNRHPSFVRHHGDTIWIPPREKPEWFRDSDLNDDAFLETIRQSIRDEIGEHASGVDEDVVEQEMRWMNITPPMQRPGFVPAAERARICIEEGARAEYWLKAHEKIGWAWLSFAFYSLGILLLMCVLSKQCISVAKAAWWPEKTIPAPSSDTRPSIDS